MTIEQHAEAQMARIIFATFDPWARPTANVPVPGMEDYSAATDTPPAARPISFDQQRRIDQDEDRAEDAQWERSRGGEVVMFPRRRWPSGGAA